MKQFLTLTITIILTLSCSIKKVVENTPKEISKTSSVSVEDIPEVVEDSITQTVEVIDRNGKTITEVDTFEEAEDLLENKIKKEKTNFKIPLPPKPPKQHKDSTFNHKRWNSLLQKHVSNIGNVDYKSIRENRTELDIYIDNLGEKMPTEDWTKNQKLAYWINAYNAMTVDLIIRNYPTESIKDIKNPWEQRLWKLGEKWYNLDEIEHQILRKMDEPRIHFAIVCASFSCPKLQNEAFTASTLEQQLTNATKAFLSDSNRNIIKKNNVKLSKIFKWFKKDFEQNGSLLDFLNKYSEIKILENAKQSYLDYNWDLND
mgnify:CR=1 FL=1